MNENILAWNFTNWVTIILMAGLGFFGLGALQKWHQNKSNATPPVVSSR